MLQQYLTKNRIVVTVQRTNKDNEHADGIACLERINFRSPDQPGSRPARRCAKNKSGLGSFFFLPHNTRRLRRKGTEACRVRAGVREREGPEEAPNEPEEEEEEEELEDAHIALLARSALTDPDLPFPSPVRAPSPPAPRPSSSLSCARLPLPCPSWILDEDGKKETAAVKDDHPPSIQMGLRRNSLGKSPGVSILASMHQTSAWSVRSTTGRTNTQTLPATFLRPNFDWMPL
ncbi:hypothetical protein DFH08DRAFT_1019713 [Mycena albidolilacea]|uniref:Uncharacterized protein n=1 Tax=Mycena albidolilacea TaxID=1033008 RepID=A0AAD6ZPL4_9AGAR|nr:hypothetical protein DFH08DRAFT_1019713 [Mycena albidolilacea]